MTRVFTGIATERVQQAIEEQVHGGDAALCTRIPTPKAIVAARPVKKHQALKATNHPITTAQLAIAQNVKHGSLHKRPRMHDYCNTCNYFPRFCTHVIAFYRSLLSLKYRNRTASVPRLSSQWSSCDRQRYWRLCSACITPVSQSSLAILRRFLPHA